MKLVKNVFYNISLSVISFFCGFLLNIILARKLLPEGMGSYSYYIWLLSFLITLSCIGIPNTLTKYVSQLYMTDTALLKNILLTLVKYQFFIILFVLPIVIIFVSRVSFIITILIFLGLIFGIINSWARSVLSGVQKFLQILIISTLGLIVELVVIIVVVNYVPNWKYAFGIHIFVAVMSSICFVVLADKDIRLLFRSSIAHNAEEILKTKKYLFYISSIIIADAIVWQKSEVFFLQIYGKITDVAFYTIAFSLAYVPTRLLPYPVGSVLMPYLSSLYGKNDMENVKLVCYNTMRYIIFFFLPIMVFCFFYAETIIKLLYGEEYLKSAIALKILLISSLVGGIVTPTAALTQAVELVNISVKISFFVGVINIILDFILIPKYTLIGAACANTTSQLLGCIIGLWWLYTVFKIKIPLGNFITSFIVAIFIIMSAKSVFTISNFFQLFLYFFIYYVLCITIFIFLKQITINEIKIIVCRKKF